MKKPISQGAIFLMHHLMTNETVSNKVKAAGEEGRSYSIYHIRDDGTVVLGETKFRFWNQLIGCQFKLTFESWALAVWDALVDLATGPNAKALEQGLSREIAVKAQRAEDYEWVVKRLYECYENVCNNKSGASSAGDTGDKGSSMTRTVVCDGEPVTININAGNGKVRTLSFPDATGKASLDFVLGITDVRVSKR